MHLGRMGTVGWTRAALGLALCFAPAADARAAGASVGHVTIQVRNEPGYSAGEVARLLANTAYLGSVVVGAAPLETMGSDLPDGAAFVGAESPTNEILTITVYANSEQRTKSVLDALIANLKTILPGERQRLQQELETAEQRFADATEAFARADKKRTELIKSKDGGDPGELRAQVSQWLATAQQDYQGSQMNLAKSQAIHDYLVEAIAKEPKDSSGNASEKESMEVANLRAQIKEAEDQLKSLQEQLKPEHPQLKVANAALDNLKTLLAAKQDQQNASRRSRRLDLERELFNNDRDLALMKGRLASLQELITKYQQQSQELMLRVATWEAVDMDQRRALERLDRTRQELEGMRDRSHRYAAGAWLQVIAGPTVEGPKGI